MASKKHKKVTKSLVVSAKFTPALVKWLDSYARKKGLFRSAALEKIVREYSYLSFIPVEEFGKVRK